MRHAREIIRQGFANKIRRCMFGFADVQADGCKRLIRRDFLKQLVELLEGIGLQAVEIGVQFICRWTHCWRDSKFPDCLLIEAGL